MPEYLVRTEGGPHPGDRVVPGPWPLPERLDDEGGYYEKVTESQMTEEMPGVIRGATYRWVAANPLCLLCAEAIDTGDVTRQMNVLGGPSDARAHIECLSRSVTGGIEHLLAPPGHKVGSCYEGSTLTYRQSALAAWDFIQHDPSWWDAGGGPEVHDDAPAD